MVFATGVLESNQGLTMTPAFDKMKAAALAFIDACEEYDQEAEYDSQKIIEIMEDVSVWIRSVEKELS
jgi:hypothetical protein